MGSDKDDLLKVLYCDSPVDQGRADESIREDVFSLLDKFDDIHLQVKPHPRYPKTRFPFTEHGRLTIFKCDDDTNSLIFHSSALIASASTVILQQVVNLKPAIFYDTWRKMLNFTGSTICDDTRAVLRASSKEELYQAVEKVLGGWRPEYHDVNEFYKKYISNGLPMGGDRVQKLYDSLRSS